MYTDVAHKIYARELLFADCLLPCEPFLPTAKCQLVVVEAREGQSFTLAV